MSIPFKEHLNFNLADELCDSPSGSSTSEPYDEPQSRHSLFYKIDSYEQLSLSNNITGPLLPQNIINQNINFWPDFNNISKNYLAVQTPSKPVEGMQIRVLGVPQTGAKSRVETQIKLCIQLVTGTGDKVQRWSHLKLPEDMVVKQNSITNRNIQTTNDMLFVRARVMCASDTSKKVTICSGCIQRERKRALRRKEQAKLEQETTKILLFNCSDTMDFSAGDTILPTRITCYCRHHDEKLGFCIYFELHDHAGNQVASGLSPPIMITDDHKSIKPGRKRLRPTNESVLSLIQPRSHLERPTIQRLIPSEGPTHGGIEITVLGTGFRSGLTCMFGNVPATTTQFWSPNTLVCILPPVSDPGTVTVSLKEYPDTRDPICFRYFYENDRALMELALQVVGLKMTGKVEDAREIARRIVQGGQQQQQQQQKSIPQHTLEYKIMQILEVMRAVRHVRSSDVSMANAQGHNLLHLAAMMGYHQLTVLLLDLGCQVNDTDINGFTPLHYAAWFSHEKIVSILLGQGDADPEISNRWNKKPIQLTNNTLIQDALKYQLAYSDVSESEDAWSSESESVGVTEESQVHTIQYLDNTTAKKPAALPLDDKKEMTWMQRTLSHFPSDNTFLQNLKTSDMNLKTITDSFLIPPTMIANMFGDKRGDQALAWYMAVAYSMGAKSLEKEKQEDIEVTIAKRRDKRLFSFWVPLLCVMVVWLIFQFISSHPKVVDTIISISGFRRQQYLTIH